MAQKVFFTNNSSNRYKYNGKEFTDDFGLDWYDYGFRNYRPDFCRFISPDPISDEFAWVNPYNYAENEPVRHIDLHGLQKFDLMGHHDVLAQQSFEKGGMEQLKADRESFQEGMNRGLAIGGAVAGAIILAPEIGAAAASAFTLETSATIIGTNIAADATIQTITNIANGNDPIDNFDVMGTIMSAVSNPIVANATDGLVDVTLGGNIEINSVDEALLNTAIGGGGGKAFGDLVTSIQKSTNDLVGGAIIPSKY